MTPRSANPLQAERTLHDYRAAHKIVPIRAPKEETLGGYVCDVDGIRVETIRGGRWRHVGGEIRVLVEKSPVRFPSESEEDQQRNDRYSDWIESTR
jgi:hypothetical protein